MHLLYLDESGQHKGRYFVLGGLAVHEKQTYFLGKELDDIQAETFPDMNEAIPFHAAEIRAGSKEPWKVLPQKKRWAILDRLSDVIAGGRNTLFAEVIERGSLPEKENEYLYAFEEIINRFDIYLKRLGKEAGYFEKGMIIIAHSEFRQSIEVLAKQIEKEGTRWGDLRNLVDIPFFTLSKNSRLLQAADFIANTVYGRYENGQARHFDKIICKFDNDDGIIHGLYHRSINNYHNCMCPACLSRRQNRA